MGSQKFSNKGKSTLAQPVSTGQTTLTVVNSTSFPSLGSGETFRLVLESIDRQTYEICSVVSINKNTHQMVVQRGTEGTAPQSFAAGDYAECRVTAATLDEFIQRDGDTMTAHLNVVETESNSPATAAPRKAYVDNLHQQVLDLLDRKVVFHDSVAEAVAASELDGGFGLHTAPGATDIEGSIIVQSGENANGFYRLWSDGYVEQWGQLTTIASVTNPLIKDFPVSYTNQSSIQVQLTQNRGRTWNYGNELYAHSVAETTFTAEWSTNKGNASATPCHWASSGY